ncbi:molecular chaperone DnaK [Pancytospora epiphaga]|nr:molecular chaperone DnaK [Pancytospora epiphaga]
MHVAIDIGAYKTTIYSTEDGGTVVEDEFGKREFSTVLALTTPVRTFGKGVSGDSPQHMLLRRRNFFQEIKDKEAQKYILMYFNYLDRLLKNKYTSAVLVVPEYFGEEERTILRTLASASRLQVGGVLSHLTGVASSAVLRNPSYSELFVIFDFGFHKSAAGAFEFKNNRLLSLKRACVRRGASDFDSIIYSILIRKYGLEDNILTRERLFQVVGSMKRGLNQLETVSASIFGDNFENIKLELTQKEFLAEAEPVIKEISSFVNDFVSGIENCDHVQVVGNNYNSKVIQDIMKDCPHATLLHPSESAALGACLAFAVNERKTKYRVEETCGSEYSVRITNPELGEEGNKSKSTVIFEKNALRNNIVGVNYVRKSPFVVELCENGKVFGNILVNKEETENTEKVKIKFKIDDFGMLEFCGAFIQPAEESQESRAVETTFTNSYEVPKEHLDVIKKTEEEFAKTENDFKMAAETRHATETYIDTFASVVEKNFPGLLSSDDKNRIEDLADGFFNKSGGSFEGELAVRKQLLEDLEFVGEKLREKQREFEIQLKGLLDKIAPYVEECKDSGDYKMHRLKISITSFLNTLDLSLEKFVEFDRNAFDQLKSNVETSVAMEEIVKKAKSQTEATGCCGGHKSKESSDHDTQDACCGSQEGCCKESKPCDNADDNLEVENEKPRE